MAAHGSVTLFFGDGEHVFNISPIGQTLELQDKCNAGVGTILQRLTTGTFFVNDFRETIRLGLIGGGMKPEEAFRLTKRYVDDRPWQESVLTAPAIIMAAMTGVPKEDVGKKEAAGDETGATTASPAPQSTESAQPSDSPQDK
jgi:hypothetical protein